MKRSISWFIVLIISASVFLTISLKTAYQMYNFFVLDTQIKANVEKIEVFEGKKDRFGVLVSYNFKIGNKNFYFIKKFQKKFLNEFVAKDFKERILKKDFFVWYNKKNPNISAIERNFPFKNLIYTVITFIIFGYFIVLKYYVFSFQKIH